MFISESPLPSSSLILLGPLSYLPALLAIVLPVTALLAALTFIRSHVQLECFQDPQAFQESLYAYRAHSCHLIFSTPIIAVLTLIGFSLQVSDPKIWKQAYRSRP